MRVVIKQRARTNVRLKAVTFASATKASAGDAEGGNDNQHYMTPLRTKQQIDARLASTPEAAAGTDGEKLLTPQTGKAAILANAKDGILTDMLPFPGFVARSIIEKLGEWVTATDFGFVPGASGDGAVNAQAVQDAIDYLYEGGGGVVGLPPGVHNCGPVLTRDRTYIVGPGKTDCYLTLPNGTNSDFIKSVGYDEFADGVKRSYLWYATTTARNAAARPSGSYAMVAPTQTDFKNAQWFRATATPASTDADWVSVGPVAGQIGGGVRGFSIMGNRENQTGEFWGLSLYGLGIDVEDIEVRGAAKSAHFESPGALLAPIGFTAQWHIRKFRCREFSKYGFYNNSQSDGVVSDFMSAATDQAAAEYLLRFGEKATGQKWMGGHLWGGADGTKAIIFEGGGNTLVAVECERPIVIKATAGGTSYLGGKIYRINALSAETGPGIEVEGGVNSLNIHTRVSHFRYCIKLASAVGIGHDIDLNYYSEDGSAAVYDPSGVTSTTALSLSRNSIQVRPSFSGVLAQADFPRLRTSKVQIRFTTITGSSGSFTPDLNVSQLYRCLGLSAGMTVNNPTNGSDGDELEMYFGQDATGGRTVSFGTNFRGVTSTSGASNQYRVYKFRFNGVFWVSSGGTGSWV